MNSSWINLSSLPLSNQQVHSIESVPKGECTSYSIPCECARSNRKEREDQEFLIGFNLQCDTLLSSCMCWETGKTGQKHHEMFSAESDMKYCVKVKSTAVSFTERG